MKCRNCKYLRWAEEYPGMPFFGWCDNVNDSPDMDMERECRCFESATNADIIRRMSNEELAKSRVIDYEEYPGAYLAIDCEKVFYSEEEAIAAELEWLQQPAEEDT